MLAEGADERVSPDPALRAKPGQVPLAVGAPRKAATRRWVSAAVWRSWMALATVRAAMAGRGHQPADPEPGKPAILDQLPW